VLASLLEEGLGPAVQAGLAAGGQQLSAGSFDFDGLSSYASSFSFSAEASQAAAAASAALADALSQAVPGLVAKVGAV
jgi:hypothetical protein